MKCLLALKKALIIKQTLVLGGLLLAGGYLYCLPKKEQKNNKTKLDKTNGNEVIEARRS